jgi:hypothetical protein
MRTKRDVIKGKHRLHQAGGFPQSKLDMAKAALPEPQGRTGIVPSGENDGDTHSLLDRGMVGRGPLSPPKRRILTYQGQRLERGAYVERTWMND